MQVERCSYFVPTRQVKQNGEKLSDSDLINIGYMAGRFGVNLQNNPNEPNRPVYENAGVLFDINACTTDCFEKNMEKAGIRFNRLA